MVGFHKKLRSPHTFLTEKTSLENGEITKQGFIELNEMEAEDAQGDVEDLWITLSSMGMNKGLIMDEVTEVILNQFDVIAVLSIEL